MNEKFLQYVWKHSLYATDSMATTDGEKLEVINPGQWNTDAGPDFFNATVKIGETVWAGNIEVHIKSSDWNLHGHGSDKSYKNVILHVVSENDQEIKPEGREKIAVFILKIPEETTKRYDFLINRETWPACSESLDNIEKIYLYSEFDSLVVDRLEYKTEQIAGLLKENKNNWEEALYRHLARSFGFQANALPFEMLARSLPLNIIAKHRGNLFQVEALLFGQSGLLNNQLLGDDYFLKLREEYSYLYSKYGLKGMEGHLWKFLRMRPVNFPTVRLAQFASLLNSRELLLSGITEQKDIRDIRQLFDVSASEYWDTHYHFNNTSKKAVKHIGDSAINMLLINTVVPFLFLYGKINGKSHLMQRALDLLESLPPEVNGIINRWKEAGITAQHAFDTQALIHLKTNYCDKKRCLYCQIGMKVICS